MPRLPSGLMFGLDPAPLLNLIREAVDGPIDSRLLAIPQSRNVEAFVDVIHFDEIGHLDGGCAESDVPLDSSSVGHASGMTLAEFRASPHSISDEKALREFFESPAAKQFFADLLFEVDVFIRTKSQKTVA